LSAETASTNEADAALQDEAAAPKATRERRSRDLYGRDRRSRQGTRNNHQAPQDDMQEGATVAGDEQAAPAPHSQPAPEAAIASVASASVVVTAEAAPPAASSRALMSKPATNYQLALQELSTLASNAGLTWVHSDAEKIRLVQAAIAATPKSVHVPREPKPLPAPTQGPLVLIETRRDLAQVVLPFDNSN
jgi:ribonuclease E